MSASETQGVNWTPDGAVQTIGDLLGKICAQKASVVSD